MSFVVLSVTLSRLVTFYAASKRNILCHLHKNNSALGTRTPDCLPIYCVWISVPGERLLSPDTRPL